MYREAPHRTVVAIDPATGETLWTFREPNTARWEGSPRQNYGRGVAYYEIDGRGVIYVVTPGFFLHATGKRESPSGRSRRRRFPPETCRASGSPTRRVLSVMSSRDCLWTISWTSHPNSVPWRSSRSATSIWGPSSTRTSMPGTSRAGERSPSARAPPVAPTSRAAQSLIRKPASCTWPRAKRVAEAGSLPDPSETTAVRTDVVGRWSASVAEAEEAAVSLPSRDLRSSSHLMAELRPST